jgi:hypothetical protein
VEVVAKVLAVLEVTDFKWTINDILAQDESWTEDILEMKSVGEEWKRIREEEQDATRNLTG